MGQLLVTLACAGSRLHPSLELMVSLEQYSPELCRLAGALLAAADGGPLGSWRGLVGALADRWATGRGGGQLHLHALGPPAQ